MGLHFRLQAPRDPTIDLLAEPDQHDGEGVVGEVADDWKKADQGRITELEEAQVDQVVEPVLAAQDFQVDALVVLAEDFGRVAPLLDGLLLAVLVFYGEVDVVWILIELSVDMFRCQAPEYGVSPYLYAEVVHRLGL